MKRIFEILILLSAVLAAGMLQNTGMGINTSTQLSSPMLVHMENNGDGEMTNSSITIGGVNAHVQFQHQMRERNGSIYISNGEAEKEVKWMPDRIKAKLEEHREGIVKRMNLTMAGSKPVYLVKMMHKLDTGDGQLDVDVDAEVDAQTGETISENQTIAPPYRGRIRAKSKKIHALIEPAHARIRLNKTLVKVNGTLDLTITTPRNKTIEVHVVKGEGATVTIDGVQVNTNESVGVDKEKIEVGNESLGVLPEKAREKIGKRAEIREMALEKIKGKLHYRMKAVEHKRILGIIPADVEIDATVDAQTGETQQHGPWWAFLAF